MKFITTIVEEEYMSVGGFGHVFYDVLTSMFIAELCNIQYLHSPMSSLGDQHHKGTNPGFTGDSITWDKFLNFTVNELPDLPRVKVNFCKPFLSMNIEQVIKFVNSQPDDTLFIQCNNCRIYPNEVYNYNRDVYYRVINKLRSNVKHLKQNNEDKRIAFHIRRGDWCSQPLSYCCKIINLVNNYDYKIDIYSLGTDLQMEELISVLGELSDKITFHINIDVFSTFVGILNANIVIGGHSNFPKIITLFGESPLIFLPYNDGIVPPLGDNKYFNLYHLGSQLEAYSNRIETDVHCTKNKDLIEDCLNH